jgi:flagellar hook-basal body complex protein FliE
MDIAAIPSLALEASSWPLAPASTSRAANAAAPGDFAGMVSQGLETVNRRLVDGQAGLQALALGQPGSLHRVMIGLEESRMSFQLLLQVRNRLLEGYQELMRMPL